MRADSALSHLYDKEICIASTEDGEREVRWSKSDWCFYYADGRGDRVCPFDRIKEWRLASIKLPH